ncbi:hypothetical protein YC2023_001195 [Brassica napus]
MNVPSTSLTNNNQKSCECQGKTVAATPTRMSSISRRSLTNSIFAAFSTRWFTNIQRDCVRFTAIYTRWWMILVGFNNLMEQKQQWFRHLESSRANRKKVCFEILLPRVVTQMVSRSNSSWFQRYPSLNAPMSDGEESG